jgi:hypothetical protein
LIWHYFDWNFSSSWQTFNLWNISVPQSLFIILGHVLGGHVTVTDGDSRLGITIMNMSLNNSMYQRWKDNLRIVYLHELMSCLCPRNEAAFLWKVSYPYWPVIHPRCVLCHESLSVGIDCHALEVTNWSSLKAYLQSVRLFKVWADLNTLNHLKVIQST